MNLIIKMRGGGCSCSPSPHLVLQLFYMVEGDMTVKIMEKGLPKDVHIREGEVRQSIADKEWDGI